MGDQKTRRFPATREEADVLDEEFQRNFEKLSLHEQERILFDIHGFSDTDEDPPSMELDLDRFDKELALIKGKYAFERAKFWNQSYVESRSFKLMFLRCHRFDVKQAAAQLVLHFECKLKLFGDNEILSRDIRISDLTGDALHALERGCVQVLPARDLGGRAVSYTSVEWRDTASIESVGRAMWYTYMAAMQDEENQKSGIVEVFYNYGNYNRGPSFSEELHASLLGLPVKFVGLHYCTNNENLMPFVAGVRSFMEESERFKFRSHIGGPHDVEFALQTFGIPTNTSPMQPDGTWSLQSHREWLKLQRTRESQQCVSGTIVVPLRFDVLFGRSKKCREHTGNLHLAHLCSMRVEEYESADKVQKTKIAESLLTAVHEMQGRFLKWEWKGWVEVDGIAAREKISHIFRHLRSKTATGASEQGPKTKGKRTSGRISDDDQVCKKKS